MPGQKRKFQFHLSTLLAVTLAAAVLLGLNFHAPSDRIFIFKKRVAPPNVLSRVDELRQEVELLCLSLSTKPLPSPPLSNLLDITIPQVYGWPLPVAQSYVDNLGQRNLMYEIKNYEVEAEPNPLRIIYHNASQFSKHVGANICFALTLLLIVFLIANDWQSARRTNE